jgi:anaerobic selenocysteine-containing dehydrogenase
MCGLLIETEGPEILSIKGDPEDPFSRGHICPKAVGLKDLHEDPDRLRRPLRKTAEGWQEISWAKAFSLAEKQLKSIQQAHGREAIATYQGNPNVHNLGLMTLGGAFLKTLNTPNRFSATSVDQLPHHVAAAFMFGHPLMIPIPDLDHTDLLIILGGNPLVSNGSMMTAPDIRNRLKAIQKREGKIVVIDPRRTQTAQLADLHHFIRPGTDVLLLLAMAQVLFAEGKAQPGRLGDFTSGLEEVRAWVQPYTPERVAAACGMSAQSIRELALRFAETPKAVIYGRMGVSTQAFGGLCQWLINVLNVLGGKLDRVGGALFSSPAVDLLTRPGRKARPPRFDRYRSRVRKLPEFSGEFPVATLADEIMTPGKGQVKALVTIAGNPVLSTPNGQQLETALQQLDFMIAIDPYLNETTRHADLILPPTSNLENDQYDLIFNLLAVRNTAKFAPSIFSRSPDARHDWEILLELSIRMGTANALTRAIGKFQQRKLRKQGPRLLLDQRLQAGPRGLSLAALKAHPHGLDLGPLEPRLPERLLTLSGKLELAGDLFQQDLPRVDKLLAEAPSSHGELLLIGRRHLRSNNSWMHNSHRLVKGKKRCVLLMHPRDAEQRDLQDGQEVRLQSAVGSLKLPLAAE